MRSFVFYKIDCGKWHASIVERLEQGVRVRHVTSILTRYVWLTLSRNSMMVSSWLLVPLAISSIRSGNTDKPDRSYDYCVCGHHITDDSDFSSTAR